MLIEVTFLRLIAWVAVLGLGVLTAPAAGLDFDHELYESLRPRCPAIVPRIFADRVPLAKADDTRIKYTPAKNISSLEDCFSRCCDEPSCNMAFMFVNNSRINCYMAACSSDPLCLPAPLSEKQVSKLKDKSFMVLVRSSESDGTWDHVDGYQTIATTSTTEHPAAADGSNSHAEQADTVVCEVGLDREACRSYEECVPLHEKSRNGVCKCESGYTRSETGDCKASSEEEQIPPKPELPKKPKKITVQAIPKEIVLPKNSVVLSASAVPMRDDYKFSWELVEEEGSKHKSGSMENTHGESLTLTDLEEGVYQFKVTVTAGEMEGGQPAFEGEAFTNVTVLPAPHPNTPPRAVLVPATQIINLPTTRAILDGSQSVDDETEKEKLKFTWELTTKPMGYQGKLEDGSTLTLDGLIAGNYTVTMTVTDSEGAKASALAKITVVPEIDYPPVANAGVDQIIYLPQNSVTLNGNQSTDEHGIVSWEWTRKFNNKAESKGDNENGSDNSSGSKDEIKDPAVDTANMRTPTPTLSNLEVGTYTFILKVTDSKGQEGTDEVNVYVKPPTNMPPTADAGEDQEISLPRNWVILDGSRSHDDVNVTSYLWTQQSGPNTAQLVNASDMMTNATGLTKGSYVFKLEVKDEKGNEAQDEVNVEVKQDTNAAPVAKAGKDFEVTLPVSEIVINGTRSYDDLRIARWKWTRDKNSLAAGSVVGDSDREPVLQLVGVVPGQYQFKLQVWDDQGKTSVDSMSLTVKPNPEEMNVIQAVLNEELTSLLKKRIDNVIQTIGLLLHNSGRYKVKVLNLFGQPDSNNAVIQFIVVQQPFDGEIRTGSASEDEDDTSNPESKAAITGHSPASSQTKVPVGDENFASRPPLFPKDYVASGKKVVKELQAKLAADAGLLGLNIISLDTLICQNDCSGHGTCHQATRTCLCEPFWVENFVRRQLMDGKSNCEWSIIYVGIFIAVLGAVVLFTVCYMTCSSNSKSKQRKRAQGESRNGTSSANGRRRGGTKYSRLQMEDFDEEDEQGGTEMRPTASAHTSSLMISESESDDEELLNFDANSPGRSGISPPDARIVNGGIKKNGSALRSKTGIPNSAAKA